MTTNFPPFEVPKSTTEEHQSKTTPTTTTIKQAPIISVMPTIRTIVATAIRPSTTRRPPTTTKTPATKAKTLLNYSAKTTHMPIDIAMTTPKQQGNKIEKQMKLQALHNVQPGPTNSRAQSIANPPEKISPVHIRSKVKLHKIEDDDKKREMQPELTESK